MIASGAACRIPTQRWGDYGSTGKDSHAPESAGHQRAPRSKRTVAVSVVNSALTGVSKAARHDWGKGLTLRIP